MCTITARIEEKLVKQQRSSWVNQKSSWALSTLSISAMLDINDSPRKVYQNAKH